MVESGCVIKNFTLVPDTADPAEVTVAVILTLWFDV